MKSRVGEDILVVKFLKRVILFIVVSFLLLNTVAFLVLNSPIIQHAVINYINLNYLKPQNLKLSLDSLSVNFFSAAFNLNGVTIAEIKKNENNKQDFNFSLNQISVGFDVPSSYLYRKPIVKKVLLRGLQVNLNYDKNGKIILPDFFKMDDNTETDIPKTLTKIIPNLPYELDILNATIALGTHNTNNFQYININLLEAIKVKENKILGLDITANINGTILNFPFLHSNIRITQLGLAGSLWQNGKTNIKRFDIESNILKLKANAHAELMSKLENSNYEANIDSLEVIGKEFLSLFNLESSGSIKIAGKLKSGKQLQDIPVFNGKAQWEKLFLQRFSLYNGTISDIVFKDKTIYYKQADIITPKNGIINTEGKFELFDDFNFENKARIEKFSFAELLTGFGLSFSPVDFNLKSPEMQVNGKIFSKNPKKYFELYATGKAFGNNLIVTTFEQKDRKPLPNFEINLNLSANLLGVYLDKSSIILQSSANKSSIIFPSLSKKSEITVPTGVIDLSQPKGVGVSVNLVGNNLNLTNLEYFLKMPTSGTADLVGSINVKAPSTEVNFQAKSTATNGELLGIKFNKIVGEWGLDTKSIFVKNTSVNMGADPKKLTDVSIEKLRYNFADSFSNIVANVTGDLNGLTSSMPHWIPNTLLSSSGSIIKLSAQLDGPLFHPSVWNLQTTSNIQDLQLLNGTIGDVNLNLSCKNGNCQKSSVILNDIIANSIKNCNLSPHGLTVGSNDNCLDSPAKPGNDNSNMGQALIQINNLSFINSDFKLQVYHFPLKFLNENLDGMLNSKVDLTGDWKNIEGTGQAQISSFKVNETEFGDLLLKILTANKKLKFKLNAFQNQLSAVLTMPEQSSNSQLDLILRNFDTTQVLPENVRAEHGLFSQLTGQFFLKGDLTYEAFHDPINMISQWKGEGFFTNAIVQYGKIILSLKENGAFTFSDGKLNIPDTSFTSNLLNIQTGGSVDIVRKNISVPINLDMNFANLQESFSNIFDSPSVGEAHAKILLSGTWQDLHVDGNMSLNADNIALKDYPPALTKLEGQINFKDKSIEIRKISAHKGKGEISLAGNIDLSAHSPNINLRANATQADFRVPIPIFLFADVNLDSDISITGQGAPYLISGDTTLHRLQMIRGITCEQMSTQALAIPKKDQTIIKAPSVNFDLNIKALNTINIQSQCLSGRFSTEQTINIGGTDEEPTLNGIIAADTANLQVLKTLFEAKKAEFQFIPAQKYDPNVDIQMQGKVNTYTIYWKMNGRLSQAKLDLSADPPVLQNGDRIIEADIISMISTGQVPPQSSNANILSASTGVASFLGINNFFDSTLNQTVNTVTGGLVDTVSVVPSSQNGQLSWRATANRVVSQRLNLGVSYESGNAGSTKTAYANYMFNDTVSAISSFNATNYVQEQPTQEVFGGLRFQFRSGQ